MLNRIRAWWNATGDFARLQGMDDRMLQDMGVTRDDLYDRVLGRAAAMRPDSPRSASLCLPTLAPR